MKSLRTELELNINFNLSNWKYFEISVELELNRPQNLPDYLEI